MQNDSTPSDDVASAAARDSRQLACLWILHKKGVLWRRPSGALASCPSEVLFRLKGGDPVPWDANSLFNSVAIASGSIVDASKLRSLCVEKIVQDQKGKTFSDCLAIDTSIRHLYSPDVWSGWGPFRSIQEVRLLARKEDRESMDSLIEQNIELGMEREYAAESVYRQHCLSIDSIERWGMYMLISGSPGDQHDVISLVFNKDGSVTINENRLGLVPALGDELALVGLATELKREIYVVQASYGEVDDENCISFQPHRPRCTICEPPIFLFMRGSGAGWAGGGFYDPLIADASSRESIPFII